MYETYVETEDTSSVDETTWYKSEDDPWTPETTMSFSKTTKSLTRSTTSEVAQFLLFHAHNINWKDILNRDIWYLRWDRLVFIDWDGDPSVQYTQDGEVREWNLATVHSNISGVEMVTVAAVESIGRSGSVANILNHCNRTPLSSRHPRQQDLEYGHAAKITESLERWRQSRKRPPIVYSKLHCFDDEQCSTETRLKVEFRKRFQSVRHVGYLDSEAFIQDAWWDFEADMGFHSDDDPSLPYNSEITYERVRFTKSGALPLRLIDMLVSIRGSMWISGKGRPCWIPTKYRMFLCELDLPVVGISVCCIIDLVECQVDGKKTRVLNPVEDTLALDEDPDDSWIGCIVVRMHNVDNIGEFFSHDKLVDKGIVNPFYRGLSVFDLPHAHWMRKVLVKERGKKVEAVIRAKTGRAGVYVLIPCIDNIRNFVVAASFPTDNTGTLIEIAIVRNPSREIGSSSHIDHVVLLAFDEVPMCENIMKILERPGPHSIAKGVEKEYFMQIIEPLASWKNCRKRPPIIYKKLDCFKDQSIVREGELIADFIETFQSTKGIAYLDSISFIPDAWLQVLDHIRGYMCDSTRLVPREVLPLSLAEILISVRGSMDINGKFQSFTSIAKYRMCKKDEIDILIASATGDVLALDPIDNVDIDVQCMVVRLHDADDIGEFFYHEKLIDKSRVDPFYRGLSVFDLPHAHWLRKVLAEERGKKVEAVVRAKTGRAACMASDCLN
ncbi:hypothetical protein BDK51DRAFT_29630 [Blyttiomyces helicus]|uniref:Uncharacterized protein n=1 Tax=Blyttiomyces helicus TaxID=388810 RepID=A0A4P9WNR7_9FUNG|nr:hypothetical protein BDK51DRAFT_29630 [Blyttiomyces helicus]|eukprot:RKO94634.1 hypothetical protein BDK51DRAFT_29630 [Blyttiomyces helicus]